MMTTKTVPCFCDSGRAIIEGNVGVVWDAYGGRQPSSPSVHPANNVGVFVYKQRHRVNASSYIHNSLVLGLSALTARLCGKRRMTELLPERWRRDTFLRRKAPRKRSSTLSSDGRRCTDDGAGLSTAFPQQLLNAVQQQRVSRLLGRLHTFSLNHGHHSRS